jgi:hypothetical protein
MKTYLLAAALATALGGGALAQTSPPTTAPSAPSTTPTAPSTTPGSRAAGDSSAPVPGANSFTEEQARQRMENAGFSGVTELRKDDQGIWRGVAMRTGVRTSVALDFRGNVVAQ